MGEHCLRYKQILSMQKQAHPTLMTKSENSLSRQHRVITLKAKKALTQNHNNATLFSLKMPGRCNASCERTCLAQQ